MRLRKSISYEGCVEMHLVSLHDQVVGIGEWVLDFYADDTVHTENSYKHQPDVFRKIAGEAGWQIFRIWTSDNPEFAIFLLKA